MFELGKGIWNLWRGYEKRRERICSYAKACRMINISNFKLRLYCSVYLSLKLLRLELLLRHRLHKHHSNIFHRFRLAKWHQFSIMAPFPLDNVNSHENVPLGGRLKRTI